MKDQYKQLLVEFVSKHQIERSERYRSTDNSKIITNFLPILFKSELSLSNNYLIKGSVGIGNWAEIPWIAIFDKEITQTTSQGYYVALLFNSKLDTLYLGLTSSWPQFKEAYGAAEARHRIREFSRHCVQILSIPDGFSSGPIALGAKNDVGKGYEHGVIVAKSYRIDDFDADELRADMHRIVSLYHELKHKMSDQTHSVAADSIDSPIPQVHLASSQDSNDYAIESSAGLTHLANLDCTQKSKGEALPPLIPWESPVTVTSDRSAKSHWFTYGVVVSTLLLIVMILNVRAYTASDNGVLRPVTETPPDFVYVPTILSELGGTFQPVGYFDDMTLFDSDTLSQEEWRNHVIFYDSPSDGWLANDIKVENWKEAHVASVVKVVCQKDGHYIHGSGINIDSSGYVLTNMSLVEGQIDNGCAVGFPDAITGLIKEAYWTTVITDKDNLTGHDLAYLTIERPIFDVSGKVYGYYSRISNSLFPRLNQQLVCDKTNLESGDEVLFFGYPLARGGAIAVTSGLIGDSHSRDGYAITSANIASTNSGGLVTSKDGCYIGISKIDHGKDRLGENKIAEIIGKDPIDQFESAIANDFDVYYALQGIKTSPSEQKENDT